MSPEAPTIAIERGASKAFRLGTKVARPSCTSADAPATAPAGASADRITRASAATGRSPSISRGFTSISDTWGWSSAIWPMAWMTFARAAWSTGGYPRNGPSNRLARISPGSSAASSSSMGAKARATSPRASVNTPPRPNATTGPNMESRFMPTISSRLLDTIRSTSTPSRAAPALSSSRRYVAAAASGPSMSSTTRPSSVL